MTGSPEQNITMRNEDASAEGPKAAAAAHVITRKGEFHAPGRRIRRGKPLMTDAQSSNRSDGEKMN